MSYAFTACLCSPDGTLTLPLRWASHDTPCPWRFFPVQVWDDQEGVIAQPYQDHEDIASSVVIRPSYELWMIDIFNPPPGWVLQQIDTVDFHDTQVHPQFKKWDHVRGEIVARPGFKRSSFSRGAIYTLIPDGGNVCHWVGAGEPCLMAQHRTNREHAQEGIRTCLQHKTEEEIARIAEDFHKVRPRAFGARRQEKVKTREKEMSIVRHDLWPDSPLDPRNRVRAGTFNASAVVE